MQSSRRLERAEGEEDGLDGDKQRGAAAESRVDDKRLLLAPPRARVSTVTLPSSSSLIASLVTVHPAREVDVRSDGEEAAQEDGEEEERKAPAAPEHSQVDGKVLPRDQPVPFRLHLLKPIQHHSSERLDDSIIDPLPSQLLQVVCNDSGTRLNADAFLPDLPVRLVDLLAISSKPLVGIFQLVSRYQILYPPHPRPVLSLNILRLLPLSLISVASQ
mmetsp:Transcript_8604/g.28679  ORF Transcript_8604/g.28679 Transcript_8604/m.28679 type:complete len:217 (-) Transcript_8604:2709-3359(-)